MKEVLLDNRNNMVNRGLSTPANIGCTADVAAIVLPRACFRLLSLPVQTYSRLVSPSVRSLPARSLCAA